MPERAAWVLSGIVLSRGGKERTVVPQVHAHALRHAPAEQQGRQRGLHLVADKAADLARAAPAVPAAQGKAAGKAVRQLQPDVQALRALLQGCELLLCDLLKRRCTKRLKTRYAIDAPRFEVITSIVLRKSMRRPPESVRKPSSMTCSSRPQTSGCAFSSSSNSTRL